MQGPGGKANFATPEEIWHGVRGKMPRARPLAALAFGCQPLNNRRTDALPDSGAQGRLVDELEQELVTRALDGDRDAFGQLVDRLKRPVFHLCMSHLRDEAEAMDLVQDTFLKAFTRLELFRRDSNFRAWVFRIAANSCIDRIRRRRTRAASELDDTYSTDHLDEGDLPSVGTFGRASPLKELARAQLADRLGKALATLPETHRQCVLLCDVHGYSYQEIAEELGIPKGTVMSRLFYARKRLQTELEDYRQEASDG